MRNETYGVVYGALARASAIINKVDNWWAVEAYHIEENRVVKWNPIYKDDDNGERD